MTVRDLLSFDRDIDVVDDVCEELYIAFCPPLKLTKAGEEKFYDVLNYPIEVWYNVVIVHIDDDEERVWKARLRKAEEFFYSAAGYCADEDYQKWFEEEE